MVHFLLLNPTLFLYTRKLKLDYERLWMGSGILSGVVVFFCFSLFVVDNRGNLALVEEIVGAGKSPMTTASS